MRAAVGPAFRDITVRWEGGYILWMFPDVYKYISGGFGLLLDPVALALTLPWKRSDGTLASRDEVVAEWSRLKNFVESNPGSEFRSWKTYEKLTTIRVTHEDMDAAVLSKIKWNETLLRQGFPEYDAWCADAQLAAHSMAWALGPKFWSPMAGRNHFPKLTAALRARDFATASIECKMQESTNPGIVPRNKGNRLMLENAAFVTLNGLDPDALFYPDKAEAPSPEREPTLPPFDIVHPDVPLDE